MEYYYSMQYIKINYNIDGMVEVMPDPLRITLVISERYLNSHWVIFSPKTVAEGREARARLLGLH